MDPTLIAILIFLGILQLAAGVVLGKCLPVRRSANREDTCQSEADGTTPGFARRFSAVVCGRLDGHGAGTAEIGAVDHETSEPDGMSPKAESREDLPEFILQSVGKIMKINERLQEKLADAEEKLQQQEELIASHFSEARTDPLTGLPNRRAFGDALEQRIAEWRRKRATFCVIAIDIDFFKKFNDGYGHPTGDFLLRSLADVFQHALREMDMVSRIGGEEFAVILPSTSAADAKVAGERLRRAVETAELHHEEQELRVTISLGIAAVATDDDTLSLVKRADEALYEAKENGRNRCYFHDGNVCLPIKGDDRPTPQSQAAREGLAASSQDRRSSDTEPDDITDICVSLRQRLAEVTGDVDEILAGSEHQQKPRG